MEATRRCDRTRRQAHTCASARRATAAAPPAPGPSRAASGACGSSLPLFAPLHPTAGAAACCSGLPPKYGSHLVRDDDGGVVLQPTADARNVLEHRDAHLLELLPRPQPREHEQLRRLHSARAQHSLTPALEPGRTRRALVAREILDAGHGERVGAFHRQPSHERARTDLQIGPAASGRQVAVRRRAAPAPPLSHLVPAKALLGGGPVVEVGVGPETELARG
eukprot:scaffold7339_cov124-Isochrysis_galbana.AAC.7